MQPKQLKPFMRAGYRKPLEVSTRPNGEINCRDYLGDGIIIKYAFYSTNQKCILEVLGRTRSLGKIEYSEEHNTLIEKRGPISEIQLRQILAWKDSFYSMVDYEYPDERLMLTKIFENLEKRLEQLTSVRESARKSTRTKIEKKPSKKTRKKRGK